MVQMTDPSQVEETYHGTVMSTGIHEEMLVNVITKVPTIIDG